MGREAPMGMMILYHDPRRPGDGGMTMITGQVTAAAAIDRLEERGFVVDKLTVSSPRLAHRGELR
jgi:hypothetical protein